MTWITITPYGEAEGRLRLLYDRVRGPDNNVDNIMLVHSLRPHTMEGHMALYKNVLHHSRNTVPKWFLEVLGVHTSLINECDYCVEHHYAGLTRLVGGDGRAQPIRECLENGRWHEVFEPRQQAALAYATKLTQTPARMTKSDVERLRDCGWTDGEILEINQVVAYFNYANRMVLGLGVDTEGDVLGLSPSDSSDTDNWQHR